MPPKKPRSRPVLTSPLLPVLVGAVALMQLVDPSRIWTSLLAGLGLAWLSSFLWVYWLASSLDIRREMRYGWAQVGDALEERFTLINRGWVPAPWVEIIDHSDMPGYNASQVRGVEASSENTWRTRGSCSRRGLFTLGPTTIRTGDPFGLYKAEKHVSAYTTLLVMPPIVPLPSIEVAPGGRAGEGRPRRDAPERTVSASTVREYVPGDSLHLIHWKTTARRDAPYVRIFDGTPSGDWWVVLDLDQTVQAGEGGDSTEEHSVILAASLADQGLRMRLAVGLAANGQDLTWLPPQQGDYRRFEILRSLALASPGTTSLDCLLERTRDFMERRSSLVIISPNPNPLWTKALVPLLWRGIVPTVLLLNGREWSESSPAPFNRPFSNGGSMEAVTGNLTRLGIRHYLIPRQIFDRPEARPGQEGRWEWRVTPRGRAIAVNKPADESWRVLK